MDLNKAETGNTNGEVRVKRANFAEQCRQASVSAPSRTQGFTAVVKIVLGSLGFTILLALSNIIPIAMLVIGGLYFDKEKYCPAENIALLLVVGGAMKLVHGIVDFCIKVFIRPDGNGRRDVPGVINALCSLLGLASFIWFIAACVIIYRLYSHVEYTSGSQNDYCDRTLYLFSFWIITSVFVILGSVMLFACCIVPCIAVIAA